MTPGPRTSNFARDTGLDVGVGARHHHAAFHAGQRRTHRVRPVGPVLRGDMGPAAHLGHAERLLDPAADPCRAGPGQLGAERGGAAHDHPQA